MVSELVLFIIGDFDEFIVSVYSLCFFTVILYLIFDQYTFISKIIPIFYADIVSIDSIKYCCFIYIFLIHNIGSVNLIYF